MDEVERVARAMYRATQSPMALEPPAEWETPWVQESEEGTVNSLADVYRIAARAALEEMRNPEGETNGCMRC